MIILTPDGVKQRFGPLFSKKFLVMVDERAGRAEILEQCHARGTIEWDAMNRSAPVVQWQRVPWKGSR